MFINKDKQYSYWISSRIIANSIIVTLSFAVDFKIIRLIYSRLFNLESFKARFSNFNRIHKPYRILAVLDLVIRLLPLCSICVYTIGNTQIYYDVWYNAIETLLVAVILGIVIIVDLIVNRNPNEDFYNQVKDRPDVMPYSYMFDQKGKLKIHKKFNFEKIRAHEYDTAISSRFFIKKEEKTANPDFSFRQAQNQGLDKIIQNEKYSKDDTEIQTRIAELKLNTPRLIEMRSELSNPQLDTPKATPDKGLFYRFSNKIKNIIDKLSPKKHSYFQLNK
jgi:hypothetical protein